MPNSIKNCPRGFQKFQKSNKPGKNGQRLFKILLKWLNFTQSGHVGQLCEEFGLVVVVVEVVVAAAVFNYEAIVVGGVTSKEGKR